jgi:RHS repeat-associated protein
MVVNDNDAITNYSYDNLGRLIKTEYPQDDRNPMSAENFTYDSVGNLKTKTNGKGTKTLEYEFFSGYRLKKVTEPGGKTVSYTYDANDNPLTQTTSGVTYTYTYDARNRVTNLKAQLDGYTFNVGYDYDTFGRVTRITYPGRNAAVNYNYNELDLLQSIPGFVESCKYDADNKLTAMALKNGISTTYAYDDNDRPIKIVAGSLLNLLYSYDPGGNITQINNDYYGYDGLNRLIWYGNMPYTQKAGATGISWSYDGAGNVTTKENYLKGTIQGSIFEYDKANRLLSMGMTIFTNDNTGSRTEKMQGTNTWRYDYDGESRLTQVNKNGVTQVQCGYDGNGMRYKKVENGKTIYYIYSGSNPLVEYSSTDGKYTYRIYAGKQAVAEEAGGVVKFYHKDHLGSTRVVTDASGKKLAEYKYEPYGEKETSTGTGSDYQFTDKTTDESTGISYFGARFYDPEVGRFISVDPAKDGVNWYAYCNNNPLKFLDTDGKKSVQSNIVLGVLAHSLIEGNFVVFGPEGTRGNEVIHPLGIADLTYSNAGNIMVGEIKPASWAGNSTLNLQGKGQLNREMKGISLLMGRKASPLVVDKMYFNYATPVPGSLDWTLRVFTLGKDPGMIYYQFDDGQKAGTPQPSFADTCSVYANCLQKTWNSLMDELGLGSGGTSQSWGWGTGFNFGESVFAW